MERLISLSSGKTNHLKQLLFTHFDVFIQCVFVLGYRRVSPLLFDVVAYFFSVGIISLFCHVFKPSFAFML